MKTSNQSPAFSLHKGFTLVELLVVIAVIAILAAIAVPTVGGVLKRVKAAESTAMATSLVRGVEDLYNDRSIIPAAWIEDGVGIDTDETVLSHLLQVTTINRTGEPYLDMVASSTEGGGLYQSGTGSDAVYKLYDAWKDDPKMFKLIADQDADGEIARPAGFADTASVRKIVIVYSAGPDRDFTTGDDNPNSWGD